MTTEELLELLDQVQKMKCESAVLEIKSAEAGCPKRLYDTLSAFSNQDEGGVLLFGVKKEDDFKEVGVYDVQDLQKKINEQALQMEPVVRPPADRSRKRRALLCSCGDSRYGFGRETLLLSRTRQTARLFRQDRRQR